MKTLVLVKYCGLQSGCGITKSLPLFNVVAGPFDLLNSTRTVDSLEAEGYEVREVRAATEVKTLLTSPTSETQKEAA